VVELSNVRFQRHSNDRSSLQAYYSSDNQSWSADFILQLSNVRKS